MKFTDYKVLARKVFPTLPPTWESMPDEKATYEFLFSSLIPPRLHTEGMNDFEKIDLFSLKVCTTHQLSNIQLTGHSVWEH